MAIVYATLIVKGKKDASTRCRLSSSRRSRKS